MCIVGAPPAHPGQLILSLFCPGPQMLILRMCSSLELLEVTETVLPRPALESLVLTEAGAWCVSHQCQVIDDCRTPQLTEQQFIMVSTSQWPGSGQSQERSQAVSGAAVTVAGPGPGTSPAHPHDSCLSSPLLASRASPKPKPPDCPHSRTVASLEPLVYKSESVSGGHKAEGTDFTPGCRSTTSRGSTALGVSPGGRAGPPASVP